MVINKKKLKIKKIIWKIFKAQSLIKNIKKVLIRILMKNFQRLARQHLTILIKKTFLTETIQIIQKVRKTTDKK